MLTRDAERLVEMLRNLRRKALEPLHEEGLPVDAPNFDFGGVSEVTYQPDADGGPGIYIKAQLNYVRRYIMQPFGQLLARAEHKALEGFRELGIHVPAVRLYFEQKTSNGPFALLATEELQGYQSLDTLLSGNPAPGQAEELLQACARTLARMHAAHWAHGACYPKHLLLKRGLDGYQVAMVDLETARRRITPTNALARDMPRLLARLEKTWPRHLDTFASAYAAATGLEESELWRLVRRASSSRTGVFPL